MEVTADLIMNEANRMSTTVFGAGICTDSAAAWGSIGAALGIFFASGGAAYGIAQSFMGYIDLARNPKVDRLMLIKGLVPGVMASVRGVYGLIISILIVTQMQKDNYNQIRGIAHFMAGLSVGLTGLASGYSMGVIGNAGLRSVAKKPILYTSFLLMIVFCEAIGLFGLIIGLILITSGGNFRCS